MAILVTGDGSMPRFDCHAQNATIRGVSVKMKKRVEGLDVLRLQRAEDGVQIGVVLRHQSDGDALLFVAAPEEEIAEGDEHKRGRWPSSHSTTACLRHLQWLRRQACDGARPAAVCAGPVGR